MCIICRKDYNDKYVEIDCSGCPDLVKVPLINGLKKLNCSGCQNLIEITPNSYLKILNCSGCQKITKIDGRDFDNLSSIDCSMCENLNEICNFKKLRTLVCAGNMRLREIDIDCLQKLFCSSTSITKISTNDPKCIDCSKCPYLEEIIIKKPTERKLKKLCCHTTSLKELPQGLENLVELNCSNCDKLTEIPFYENLQFLIAWDSLSLKKIQPMKRLQMLNTFNCRQLIECPGFHNGMYEYTCKNCPWINYQNPNYQRNIEKIIVLQKWFQGFVRSKKMKQMIKCIVPIYYHPDNKGGYFHKKKMLEFMFMIEHKLPKESIIHAIKNGIANA